MGTLQTYLARTIPIAANDLAAAFERLPEDKRTWSPMGQARTALDQAAECAVLNGSTPDLLTSRTWDPAFFEAYEGIKAEWVAKGWDAVKAELLKNADKAAAAVAALSDADLGVTVDCPWGLMTLEQIAAYPFWNMGYHEAQMNYLASMLGCL